MKAKKIAAFLCVSVLLAATMSACGSSETESVKSVAEAAESVQEEAGETAETDGEAEPEAEAADTESDTVENTADEITIEEQVLVDQDGIKITATGYVQDSFWGDGISLLVENDSDADVLIGCTALIVNDFMINDLFGATIAAGKKSNETMYLSASELKAAGIDPVGKIEVYFHAYDDASYDTIFETDCVTIQTSQFDNMDTTADDTGLELYNEGGIRIVGKTVDENSFWGTAILLYCENTSGRNVGISAEDISINGFMIDGLYSSTVYDGKKSLDDVTIFSTDLEANGIETIEEVELKFHIYDTDTFETIADSEPITFTAS